jgi:methanogenic corrinoid protein MtbC1
MLTTFPEEFHSLGLLMVEAMMVTEGACCLSLGVHMPLDEIRQAASQGAFDVLALSFSAAYPARQAVEGLRSLRQQLPARLAIWAGGAGLNEVACRLTGIQVFRNLDAIPPALACWRQGQSGTQA